MAIKEIYRKPMRKAAVFLYPILGISSQAKFKPSGVYIALEDEIQMEEQKLICVYDTSASDFAFFSSRVLESRKNLLEFRKIAEDSSMYIFDYQMYGSSWDAYLNAKYSQFDEQAKKLILKYYSPNLASQEYVKSFLYPQQYFGVYAKILDVPIQLLKEVGELCSKPDLEEEIFRLSPSFFDPFDWHEKI